MRKFLSILHWKPWSFIFLLGACLTVGNVQAQVSSPTFTTNATKKAEKQLKPEQQKELDAKKLAHEKAKKASMEAVNAKKKAFIDQMRVEYGEKGAQKAMMILEGKTRELVYPSISTNRKKPGVGNPIILTTVTDYPYTESFEGTDGDWVAGGTNSSWERGVPDPTNAIIDAASEGTEAWVTNLAGNYNTNEESWVESPVFDFSAVIGPKLSFDYKYNTENNFDGVVLQYSTDDGTSWTDFDDWTGAGSTAGSAYLKGEYDLTFLAGESSVMFRFFLSSDFIVTREGFAFDNVRISDPQDDLSVSAIDVPGLGVFSNAEAITIEIDNIGKRPASGFDVVLEVDGTVVATEAFTGTINNGESASYTFTTSVDLSVSTLTEFTLNAYPVFAEEDEPGNDAFSTTVLSQIMVNSYPYSQGFEDGNGGSWGTADSGNGAGSTWEVGIPEGPDVIGASEEFVAWTTKADGLYLENEQSWVFSPIFDFTNNSKPIIEFDLAYNLENGWDGVAFQYSTDLGETWTNLGDAGDAGNWFNGNVDGPLATH